MVDHEDESGHIIDGNWRSGSSLSGMSKPKIEIQPYLNPTLSGKAQCELLMKYFVSSEGAVEWQQDMIA